MKTLPLRLNIPGMQKKLHIQGEELRFNTIKHLLILRYKKCIAISQIIEITEVLKVFSKDFIREKIEKSVTEEQLFTMCRVIRDFMTLNLIPFSYQEMQLLTVAQLEKIYNKQL